MRIGILGLQGNVNSHQNILQKLEIDTSIVRYPSQLDHIDGLVIPGGESTTMTNLLDCMDLYNPIRQFAKSHPVLGTCAGLILMAKKVKDSRVRPLGLLDISVDRNGFGRQIYSFSDSVIANTHDGSKTIKATFIRAPKISNVSDSVRVIAKYNNEPIAVKEGKHVGLTFHPELDGETFFHKLMMEI